MRKLIVVSLMLAVCICGLFYGDVIAQQVTRGVQVITSDLRVGGNIYGLHEVDVGGTLTAAIASPTVLAITEKTPVNAVTAKDTLTSDETVPTHGDTLKVGDVTYTLVDTLTVTYAPEDSSETTPLYTANEIVIGETYDVTLANIRLCINATDQDTTTYAPGTVANADVIAGTIASTALPLAARTVGIAGNSIALVSESEHLTAASATFTGGVDGTTGVANELCVDDSYLYHCTATNTISGANWRRVSLGSAY
jgi:hypothetical protein